MDRQVMRLIRRAVGIRRKKDILSAALVLPFALDFPLSQWYTVPYEQAAGQPAAHFKSMNGDGNHGED